MVGFFPPGSSGLGWLAVIGRSRVPSPPALTPAFTCYPSPPANTAYLPSFHRRRARVMASVPAAPSRPTSPRPARPPLRPWLVPGPSRQAACLLQVQHGGPPVKASSPDREGPTDDPRHQR